MPDILDIIKSRRSIRNFRAEPVPENFVEQLLEAGRWAPSGLNNQPWRFAIITDRELIAEMAKLTRYSKVVLNAPLLITVFLDTGDSYHREKDIQAVGACLQNILLEAHALGLGAVWLGEIIKSNEEVKALLEVENEMELMAVVAIGYPEKEPQKGKRKDIRDLVIFSK